MPETSAGVSFGALSTGSSWTLDAHVGPLTMLETSAGVTFGALSTGSSWTLDTEASRWTMLETSAGVAFGALPPPGGRAQVGPWTPKLALWTVHGGPKTPKLALSQPRVGQVGPRLAPRWSQDHLGLVPGQPLDVQGDLWPRRTGNLG